MLEGHWVIDYTNDLLLSDNLIFVERRMFAVVESQMKSHRVTDAIYKSLAGDCAMIYPHGQVTRITEATLEQRADMLDSFNSMLQLKRLGFPSSDMLSYVICDLTDTVGIYDPYECDMFLSQITGEFIEWCRANKRLGVCVQHKEQRTRVPHIHMLYERSPLRRSEFQQHLNKVLGKQKVRKVYVRS